MLRCLIMGNMRKVSDATKFTKSDIECILTCPPSLPNLFNVSHIDITAHRLAAYVFDLQ